MTTTIHLDRDAQDFLWAIVKGPVPTRADVAQQQCLQKGKDRLETLGLVEVDPEDEDRWRLTPRGWNAAEDLSGDSRAYDDSPNIRYQAG